MFAPSPGVKTTEFWALLLLAAIVVANGTEWVNIPSDQLTWIGTTVAGYIGVRGFGKHSMAKASVEMAKTGQPAGSEPLKSQGG